MSVNGFWFLFYILLCFLGHWISSLYFIFLSAIVTALWGKVMLESARLSRYLLAPCTSLLPHLLPQPPAQHHLYLAPHCLSTLTASLIAIVSAMLLLLGNKIVLLVKSLVSRLLAASLNTFQGNDLLLMQSFIGLLSWKPTVLYPAVEHSFHFMQRRFVKIVFSLQSLHSYQLLTRFDTKKYTSFVCFNVACCNFHLSTLQSNEGVLCLKTTIATIKQLSSNIKYHHHNHCYQEKLINTNLMSCKSYVDMHMHSKYFAVLSVNNYCLLSFQKRWQSVRHFIFSFPDIIRSLKATFPRHGIWDPRNSITRRWGWCVFGVS